VQTDNDYDKDVFNGDLGYQHQALSHKQTGCKFNLKLGWADAPDLI
jgi:ATP-dependent exoDNAse (exonuclease V) alpha subunit